MKEYLVKLDTNYSPITWWKVICEIKKYSTKIEVISTVIPILLVVIYESDLDSITGLEGIDVIEENSTFEAF